MSKMIPLHIADAAVAACEKEIQELRAEVQRLRKGGDSILDQWGEAEGRYDEHAAAVERWNDIKKGGQP